MTWRKVKLLLLFPHYIAYGAYFGIGVLIDGWRMEWSTGAGWMIE